MEVQGKMRRISISPVYYLFFLRGFATSRAKIIFPERCEDFQCYASEQGLGSIAREGAKPRRREGTKPE
jgi:hypothetical protein